MERLASVEREKHSLLKECHEMREQNELLEFRIVELEESNDKVRCSIELFCLDEK